MKNNNVVKINNQLKNKGVEFPDDATFSDLLQSFNYLTRFMFDLIEGKADYCLIPQDEKANSKSGQEFKAFLKFWYEYAEKSIPDDDNFKVTIEEFRYEK